MRSQLKSAPDRWILFVGILLMYLPTLWGLLVQSGLWTDDQHSHGPIVLAISLWLLWKRWEDAQVPLVLQSSPIASCVCFLIGAILYVPGRALDIIYFETGSFIWMLTGVILLIGGVRLFKIVQFPLLFMIFMIPLPNSLIGPLSDWMKLMVSNVTVDILSSIGLPVAQSGVIISLGQYKLLVAEACAGMRTLFMLETLGILYLNLVQYRSLLRNIVLPFLIIPISFSSNVIRVLILCLITYYLGDEAGQGFLHGLAGMVLFMTGLVIMLAADYSLRLISKKFHE